MSARRVSLGELAQRATASPTDLPGGGEDAEPARASMSTEAVLTAETVPAADPQAEQTGLAPTATRQRRPSRQSVSRAPEPSPTHYSNYIAKQARLRDDQYGELTAESRRLNRLRKGRGQRITENTLIRVAIDLLLSKQDELVGTDENELRRSVGL